MSKKFLLLAFLPLLASCSMNSTIAPVVPADFDGMYKEHVKTQVSSIRDFMHTLGYRDEYNFIGSIKAALSVPNIMSGTLSTDYSSQVKGHDASVVFANLHSAYEMILGTGSLDADEVALISKAGDTFFRLSGLKPTDLIDVEIQNVLKKYDKSWLSMTAKDIEATMSGASESDLISYKISQAITSMTLSDIESYMIEYPVWKKTKDLDSNNDMHSYAVELHRENIVSMVDAFVTKATGKPLDDASRADLVKSLSQVNISGVMSFNPSKKDDAIFSGSISQSGSTGAMATFMIKEAKDTFSLISQSEEKVMSLDMTRGPQQNTLSFVAKEKGTELFNISGSIMKQGEKIDSMNMVLASQGMTVELTHKNNPDGTFDGKVNFGIGNLTWKGTFTQNKLTLLSLAGAMIGKSMTLDLTKGNEDMVAGPLVVKSGADELVRANLGLRIVPERFTLTADMPMPGSTDTTQKSHIEVDVTSKNVSSPVNIIAPTPAQSFKILSDELSALVTHEEDISTGMTEPGLQIGSDALPITNN